MRLSHRLMAMTIGPSNARSPDRVDRLHMEDVMKTMTGEKSQGSNNPSAVRIRDNQRRSRARHKEYVEGLQKKLQEFERRGIDATLEMQQAARNVATENSRLRILLGYHGISSDEIDKFLQSFPDQPATDAAKATISQNAVPSAPLPTIVPAPKMSLPPLSRPPSTEPARALYSLPRVAKESSTRDVVDAVVGIKRDTRKRGPSPIPPPVLPPQLPIPVEQRQTHLQPRPQLSAHPVLPALVLGQGRPEPTSLDKLSVLATASAHQDSDPSKHQRTHSRTDSLQVPSPPTARQSSPTSSNAGTPSRLSSVSPGSQGYMSKSPGDMSYNSAAHFVVDDQGRNDVGSTRSELGFDDGDEDLARKSKVLRVSEAKYP